MERTVISVKKANLILLINVFILPVYYFLLQELGQEGLIIFLFGIQLCITCMVIWFNRVPMKEDFNEEEEEIRQVIRNSKVVSDQLAASVEEVNEAI
ncbi:hypothetical protein [Alkalihalobacterium alkalinitrilicum]|uniref:hypothetical protein n=1 Tax=Alkalihalobacterium alkalinitrilicum TaxID=427920 RepID=UPI000994AC84|nr:hypothetical protein [Alkalihalobacterium alkalinitrilicum]